jgi:hypothetical protein
MFSVMWENLDVSKKWIINGILPLYYITLHINFCPGLAVSLDRSLIVTLYAWCLMVYFVDMCLINLSMYTMCMVLVKDAFTLCHDTLSRARTEGLLWSDYPYWIIQYIAELLWRWEFCFCMCTVLVLEMCAVFVFHLQVFNVWLSAIFTKIHQFKVNSS